MARTDVRPGQDVSGSIEYFDAHARRLEEQYVRSRGMRSRLERFGCALLERVKPPASVLDFGCGSGDLSAHLAGCGYRVQGIDQSPGMIARARSRFALPNLDFRIVARPGPDGYRLPFDTGQFGACSASSVLEYVKPIPAHLRELRRVVQREGVLIATVPGRWNVIRVAERLEQMLWSMAPSTAALWPRRRVAYLELSVNRLPLRAWAAQLGAAGWHVESVEGRARALALICARAV